MSLEERLNDIYNIYPFCKITVNGNQTYCYTNIIVDIKFRGDDLHIALTIGMDLINIEVDKEYVENIYREVLDSINKQLRMSYDRNWRNRDDRG